jgi:hypothetical protein
VLSQLAVVKEASNDAILGYLVTINVNMFSDPLIIILSHVSLVFRSLPYIIGEPDEMLRGLRNSKGSKEL